MTDTKKIETPRPGGASQAEICDEIRNENSSFSNSSKADFHEKSQKNPSEKRFQNARDRSDKVREKHEKRHAPFPLQRETIAPRPFPFEALGPYLEPVARRLQEIIRAPDAICGQCVLATVSLVVQPHGNISIDGRECPLSLFFLTVAFSGDRKSGVDKEVLKAVRAYEKMLAITFEKEMREFNQKHYVWKKKRENLFKGDKQLDEKKLESDFKNLGEEPQRPLDPFLIIQEPTFPALIQLYSTGQPNLGLFADEGGQMFGGYGMKDENLLGTICGLSSLWDGQPLSRIRKSDPNLLLYGRRLALHLMIQETVFANVMKNEQLVGQGMLARCLIAFPETTAGSRPYNEIDVSLDETIQKFHGKISDILKTPLPLKDSNIRNELSPRSLCLSREAKVKWVHFHDEVDSFLKPDGKYRPISRTANKAAEQALRLSGVLTLFEDLEAKVVEVTSIERAIVLMRFYLDEMLRIIEMGFVDSKLALADSLLAWMKKTEADEGTNKIFDLRDICRNGPPSIRKKEDALKVLFVLEDHEFVMRVQNSDREWSLRDGV